MKKFVFLILFTPLYSFAQKEKIINEIDINKVASFTLKLEGFPDFLVADGNDVWITNQKRIDKLSINNKKPILSVAMSSPCGAMSVAFGALWVANCDNKSIYKIDNKTGHIIAIIKTGLAEENGELSIAAGAGSIWVLTDGSGILTRIDPIKNRVQANIKVLPFSYCAAFGYNSVWVTNTGNSKNISGGEKGGVVQRIDPTTNQVVATIPTGIAPHFLAVGENAVWTLNQFDGTVSKIDPLTNHLISNIKTNVSGSGGDIAVGAGRVWVRGSKTAFLVTINTTTNSIAENYGPVSGSGAVRVTENNNVWISAHDINTIWVLKK